MNRSAELWVVVVWALVASALSAGLLQQRASSELRETEEEVAQARREVARLAVEVDAVEAYERAKAELATRARVVEEIAASAPSPYRIVSAVTGDHRPAELRLVELHLEGGRLSVLVEVGEGLVDQLEGRLSGLGTWERAAAGPAAELTGAQPGMGRLRYEVALDPEALR